MRGSDFTSSTLGRCDARGWGSKQTVLVILTAGVGTPQLPLGGGRLRYGAHKDRRRRRRRL